MSDLPDSPAPADETPAQHIAAAQKKKNIYKRITSSMPLLITVIVHVLLIGGAAAIVVQQAGGGKKKTFEAVNQTENANKQVEHRLQVARRGGASSASQSPVSANRIFSTAENALQMPAMPDLPSMGAGGFGGFGGMGSGVGMGAGSGMSTSLGGGTGLGGRGFMSLSFLGMTNQDASKVVFVVDTSTAIMEPRKGGFQAFTIIREQIMSLVARLSPNAEFNVVLFEGKEINVFQRTLIPATSDYKKEFIEWMQPVNTTFGSFGYRSAKKVVGWRFKKLTAESQVDPDIEMPSWARGVQIALEQQADVVFVITAGQGKAVKDMGQIDEATLAKRIAANEKARVEEDKKLAADGFTRAGVNAARDKAYAKLRADYDAANRKLVAEGKDPVVIARIGDYKRPDIDKALRAAGIKLSLDKSGWTRKDGSEINLVGGVQRDIGKELTWEEFMAHYARLQNAVLPKPAKLNIFLFVGPEDNTETSSKNLSAIAKRNRGSFQLLTTKRLEEIKARQEAEDKK